MDIQHEKGGFTMRPRTLLLFALAALLGAAVAVLPALAASPSEAKLEVNENCVEPDWPCWATPGSSQPASKVTIASGGSVTFADSKAAANIAWTGTAPTCESAVPVAPASPKTGWEGKCTFATPGTYNFESSTLFNEAGLGDYTKYAK
jgi:plastocyanin